MPYQIFYTFVIVKFPIGKDRFYAIFAVCLFPVLLMAQSDSVPNLRRSPEALGTLYRYGLLKNWDSLAIFNHEFYNQSEKYLTDSQSSAVSELLKKYHDSTGVRMELYMTSGREDSAVFAEFEDYSLFLAMYRQRYFERKDSHSVFLLISPGLRKIRVQNNRNVQRYITDIETKQCIEGVKIYFRSAAYDTAMEQLFSCLATAIGIPFRKSPK